MVFFCDVANPEVALVNRSKRNVCHADQAVNPAPPIKFAWAYHDCALRHGLWFYAIALLVIHWKAYFGNYSVPSDIFYKIHEAYPSFPDAV